jgi:hypothetical protein
MANLNGTHVRSRFITGADGPLGVVADNGYIYWTNPGLLLVRVGEGSSGSRWYRQ